jgi:hypothetical protein
MMFYIVLVYLAAFAGGMGYELIAERRENKLLGGLQC